VLGSLGAEGHDAPWGVQSEPPRRDYRDRVGAGHRAREAVTGRTVPAGSPCPIPALRSGA